MSVAAEAALNAPRDVSRPFAVVKALQAMHARPSSAFRPRSWGTFAHKRHCEAVMFASPFWPGVLAPSWNEPNSACAELPPLLAKSTLSRHFRVMPPMDNPVALPADQNESRPLFRRRRRISVRLIVFARRFSFPEAGSFFHRDQAVCTTLRARSLFPLEFIFRDLENRVGLVLDDKALTWSRRKDRGPAPDDLIMCRTNGELPISNFFFSWPFEDPWCPPPPCKRFWGRVVRPSRGS